MTATYSTADVIRYLLRFKWLLIGISAIAAIGTYVYMRTLPEYFKATINCVPPSEDAGLMGGMLGGLSSTLKDVGLSKISSKRGESFEFIVILFTRTIADSMINRFNLVEEYQLQGKPLLEVRDEFNNNLLVKLHAEGNYEISLWSKDPHKAVEMCNSIVLYANEITNRIKRQEASKSAEYLERRIRMMDSALDALTDTLNSYSKVYRLFSPLDQAKASATALAEAKADLLRQETMLGILEANYGKDDPQVKATSALVRQLNDQYEQAQTKPGFAGNFALTDASGIGARYLKVYAEFEAFTKLKAFMMPSLEQAKLDVFRTSPALIVVDTPLPAEKRDRPKRALVSAGVGLGVFVATMLILISLRAWQSMMSEPKRESL